jgi:hypothetical protein
VGELVTRLLSNLILLPLLAVGITLLLIYCMVETLVLAVWEYVTYKTKWSVK